MPGAARDPVPGSWLPLTGEGHHPGECRLAALELPREAAEDETLVLQFRGVDVSAQVLDVHAVLREQRVVRELVGRIGKQLRDRLRSAEFFFRLLPYPIAMAERPLPEESSDRQVHRVIGRD